MLSRGYLQAWANGRNLVHVWDSENLISGVRSLNDATVVNYAYETSITIRDVEGDYAKIEDRALPALRALANGGSLNSAGEAAVIAFLDMHTERGRYADQAKVRMPIAEGNLYSEEVRMAEMTLGDRLALARDLEQDVVRISSLGVQNWPWQVISVDSGLITGDGAALMWNKSSGTDISAISFPLSPTKLLVLGSSLDGMTLPINAFVASRSRRWLVDHVEGRMASAMTFRPRG